MTKNYTNQAQSIRILNTASANNPDWMLVDASTAHGLVCRSSSCVFTFYDCRRPRVA